MDVARSVIAVVCQQHWTVGCPPAGHTLLLFSYLTIALLDPSSPDPFSTPLHNLGDFSSLVT